MPTSTDPSSPAVSTGAPFGDILCAVDGSRGSAEGVRQAIELARPDGRIAFLAITDVRGVGANRIAGVGEHRADMALAGARALARDHDLHCDIELVHAVSPVDEILRRQPGHRLLVAGCHRGSRAAGMVKGSAATVLVHRTAGPLLIAKPASPAVAFPRRIVVATDGSREDDLAVLTAIRIAVARDAHVDVVHATRGGGVHDRGALGALAALVWSRTGREPLVTEEGGEPAELIARVAERDGANLVVVGHGGRHGIRALASVSEQVVHRALCSVLVMPTA